MNKLQIRHSIFETNSSSTHSLVFSGGKLGFKEFNPNSCPEGCIILTGGEYGWGPYTLHRWEDKANYCYTYAMMGAETTVDKIERERLLQMLREVLTEYTGLDVNFGEYESDYYDYGYIDHQSADVCYEAFTSKDMLKDLIWGVGSSIIIDNDNH